MENMQLVESYSNDYVPSLSMTPQMAKGLIRQLDQLKKEVMRNKIDYDIIPGTPKPSLLKPGAERLLMCFGLGHRVHEVRVVEDWENGFFHYVYKVTIHKSYPTHEIVVAECIGSANSKEKRYKDRWVYESEVIEMGINPKNLEKKQRKSKNGKPYFVYKVENPDPYSIVNTLQKMAIKRALVGATLQATGTSEFFTQDLEDFKQPTTTKDPEPTPPPTTKRKQQTESVIKEPETVVATERVTPTTLDKIKAIWNEFSLAPELINLQTEKLFKKPLYELDEAEQNELLSKLEDMKNPAKSKNRYATLFAAGEEQHLSAELTKSAVYDKFKIESLKELDDKKLADAVSYIKSGGTSEQERRKDLIDGMKKSSDAWQQAI